MTRPIAGSRAVTGVADVARRAGRAVVAANPYTGRYSKNSVLVKVFQGLTGSPVAGPTAQASREGDHGEARRDRAGADGAQKVPRDDVGSRAAVRTRLAVQ